MPRRSRRVILTGRIVFTLLAIVLIVYLSIVGLDKADKIASTISVFLAAIALVGPYLLPKSEENGEPVPGVMIEGSGSATAIGGGHANTGVQRRRTGASSHVRQSGDARAEGPGSIANTGIRDES